jgi:hypothetical protein
MNERIYARRKVQPKKNMWKKIVEFLEEYAKEEQIGIIIFNKFNQTENIFDKRGYITNKSDSNLKNIVTENSWVKIINHEVAKEEIRFADAIVGALEEFKVNHPTFSFETRDMYIYWRKMGIYLEGYSGIVNITKKEEKDNWVFAEVKHDKVNLTNGNEKEEILAFLETIYKKRRMDVVFDDNTKPKKHFKDVFQQYHRNVQDAIFTQLLKEYKAEKIEVLMAKFKDEKLEVKSIEEMYSLYLIKAPLIDKWIVAFAPYGKDGTAYIYRLEEQKKAIEKYKELFVDEKLRMLENKINSNFKIAE